MKVYKYSIDEFYATHELPRGFIVRHVGLDPQNVPSVWVEVDTQPDAITSEVMFMVFPTGCEIDKTGTFCGTFMVAGFVGHVYSKIMQD